ncbi:uncharacterized protein LOC129722611 isoform X2 [Wyeomyia smithii]|uniref:uncharacterized protein LOC129722611 isoform X2 n=1 Tax=Wyeomyia smithii TaxID=174621 RepID=UPI002467BA09|nr:uncharacterized protein LOC129722611 isoform X2 [Wyeomyia smithii]
MKSVTLVIGLMLVLLTQKSSAITNNANKKVSSSGDENQSVTFSSYGEDQLIFKDSSFQLRNGVQQKAPHPLRRISDENSDYEFFEAGWRPLYSFKFENGRVGKVADQLPQENTRHSAVETNFVTRNKKYVQFSESDVMPLSDQVKPQISENMIKFGSDSESEEEYDDSSAQGSEEYSSATNATNIYPRMLQFEESDRMNFATNVPNTVKHSKDNTPENSGNREEPHSAMNYDVFVIENLMKNASGTWHAEKADLHSDGFNFSQLQKLPVKIRSLEENYNDSPRNSSRYFRFEESETTAEKPRIEKSPMNSFNFYNHDSYRNEFRFPASDVSAKHETPHTPVNAIKFVETDSMPQSVSSSQMRFDDDQTRPLKFTDSATQIRPQTDNDQFYTVKATIQIGNWGSADSITPPTVYMPITTRRPKQKKGKIYNQHVIDIRKQDEFNYQQPPDYDNYLQNSPQPQTTANQYPSNLQISPTPQIATSDPYYQNLPSPGTFGNYQTINNGDSAQAPSDSTYAVNQQDATSSSSPIMAVSTQLRKALDNISGNDELQCVPKLICMMSRRSSGQGFSTYVNRGLLSTILSAVPDSSPWLKFSRAALLGYGIGANSCDVYYPKCPKDESEIIYYLNNHRGGFFRFFNDEHNSASKG